MGSGLLLSDLATGYGLLLPDLTAGSVSPPTAAPHTLFVLVDQPTATLTLVGQPSVTIVAWE